jgi:hypothetical protein
MPLTTGQAVIFRADVEADQVLNALPPSADSAFAIADAYKLTANPVFIVWRTSVQLDEIMQNGFDWTRVNNLSVGNARIWEWLFDNEARTINPSRPNVRAGIDETWKGTAADLAVRAAVYVHCKRQANRLEKLFATGTGSDASPGTMVVEGSLNYNDVALAMGWNV